jgi:O-6-methylguanine DNA methyltransferase
MNVYQDPILPDAHLAHHEPGEVERRFIHSRLGWIGIEYGARGLRRIDLHDSLPDGTRKDRSGIWSRLEADAVGRFARVDAAGWARHFDEIRHRAEGHEARHPLPIDEAAREALAGPPDSIRARTWRLLETIPRGEVWTYGDLARRLGRPSAARAVGQACAANPLLIVVPCHRVVRSDGSAGGYRAGHARKAALLRAEGGR